MMRHWKLKAAVQGTLSLLPGSQAWNFLLQQYVTRTLPLTETTVEQKLRKASQHLAHVRDIRGNDELPASVLELGTGWYPLVPLGLYLAGVRQVITCDIQCLLSRARVRDAMAGALAAVERGAFAEAQPERVEKLREVIKRPLAKGDGRETLAELGIDAKVADICSLDLAPGSVDLILSNNTFEHIPGPALARMLAAFHGYLGATGLQSHHIDLADHYSSFDPSIGPRHFLRFTDRQWRWYNNDLQYQNRLQLSDYRALHEEAGFEILTEQAARSDPQELDRVPLAPQFAEYDREELLVTNAWFVSRPHG